MPGFMLALVIGVFTASCFARLPSVHFLWLFFPLIIALLLFRRRALLLLCALFLGLAWGVTYGHLARMNILPEALAGKDIIVQGRIADIPLIDSRRQRFTLAIETASTSSSTAVFAQFPKQIQVSWYDLQQKVVTGERWRFQVRLKQPRGFINPGGFDYEVWLLRREIGALGYVRNSSVNQQLNDPGIYDINHWRYELREWLIRASSSPHKSILLALLIGDRSLITDDEWQILQQTGTNHLVAISGLHVGFVALLGMLLGNLAGRVVNLVFHRPPPVVLACICASSFALLYSALAGFSLPTQRALIMVLVAQYALLMRRSVRARDALLLAFVLVLLRDPLAAYDPGFWLSFGAVTVLLFAFVGRIGRPGQKLPGRNLVYSQWVVFIGLLLPLALLMNTASLLAPAANMLAIPLVTFLVVPSLLGAAMVAEVMPGLSSFLLDIADAGLRVFFWWLNTLVELADGHLFPTLVLNWRALPLAAFAILLLLAPRAWPGRWLGYPMLLIAVLVPVKMRAPLQLTVMDVGQGLAVVVQTANHTLVYDAGPAYGESFDAGSGILLPYLRREGVRRLDKLVISHNDKDHAGGLTGLSEAIPIMHTLWGEPPREGQVQMPQPASSCHLQPPWTWDQVSFRFLVSPTQLPGKPNDYSCVLLVEFGNQSILLPGDISESVEQQLLGREQLPRNVTLLLAAHHGSRSSSSPPFVRHVNPEIVVYSAGYRNQHGHPHPAVKARFDALGARSFSTAESGAVEFLWDGTAPVQVIEYRQHQRRYWHQ